MILMIIIADEILEVYFKKHLSSTLFTTIETLLIAIVSYAIIANPFIKSILFQFPLIVLGVVLINILIGRYTGLRLTELNRFYELLIDQKDSKDEDSRDTEE